jgi:hypothetical protein
MSNGKGFMEPPLPAEADIFRGTERRRKARQFVGRSLLPDEHDDREVVAVLTAALGSPPRSQSAGNWLRGGE